MDDDEDEDDIFLICRSPESDTTQDSNNIMDPPEHQPGPSGYVVTPAEENNDGVDVVGDDDDVDHVDVDDEGKLRE